MDHGSRDRRTHFYTVYIVIYVYYRSTSGSTRVVHSKLILGRVFEHERSLLFTTILMPYPNMNL